MVTAPGSIIVASTSPKSTVRPGKRKWANPKATIVLDTATVVAARSAMAMLLNSQWSRGSWDHTSA